MAQNDDETVWNRVMESFGDLAQQRSDGIESILATLATFSNKLAPHARYINP